MDFKLRVEHAFNQWNKNAFCEEARSLNEGVGIEYFDWIGRTK